MRYAGRNNYWQTFMHYLTNEYFTIVLFGDGKYATLQIFAALRLEQPLATSLEAFSSASSRLFSGDAGDKI